MSLNGIAQFHQHETVAVRKVITVTGGGGRCQVIKKYI